MKRLILIVLVVVSSMGLDYTCSVELDPMYTEQIEHDLATFSQGITKEMLQKVKSITQCMVQFKDGVFESSCNVSLVNWSRKTFAQIAKYIPDLTFAYNPLDQPRIVKNTCKSTITYPTQTECYCDPGFIKPDHWFFWDPHPELTFGSLLILEKLPLFSSATVRSCFLDILLPAGGYLLDNILDLPKSLVPWEKKEFKAYWRGSLSGCVLRSKDDNFMLAQRLRLIHLCRSISQCDAQISRWYSAQSQDALQILKKDYPLAEYFPLWAQDRFKILIDVDGITYSLRFPNLLQLKVGVFKIAAFLDFGGIAMRPWEHFVPVKLDMSDFEDKLRWAKNNDMQLRKIAERGWARSREVHNIGVYKCYLVTLLTKYHQLLVKGGAINPNNNGRLLQRNQ